MCAGFPQLIYAYWFALASSLGKNEVAIGSPPLEQS